MVESAIYKFVGSKLSNGDIKVDFCILFSTETIASNSNDTPISLGVSLYSDDVSEARISYHVVSEWLYRVDGWVL